MLLISQTQADALAATRFVERMATMLRDSQAVPDDGDYKMLCTEIAMLLDEASAQGIRSERLLGMVLMLHFSDQIDAFVDRPYASILCDDRFAEADRAHLLQMLRLG